MRRRLFIRLADNKTFLERDTGITLYHPEIDADDGESDTVKCVTNDRYVSLNKGFDYSILKGTL